MKYLLSIAALVILAGCETTYTIPEANGGSVAPLAPVSAQPVARSVQEGDRMYSRVSFRMKNLIESVCREELGTTNPLDCQFEFNTAYTPDAPNAFQTFGTDGNPVILFNSGMLATIRNENEMAFIIGHEAGHQIAGHLAQKRAQAGIGAVLGALAGEALGIDAQSASQLGSNIGGRAYSQSFELEADVIGTYIALLSGYDPVDGAQSFARFSGSNSPLSSHPPGTQRFNTVVATADMLRSQIAAGQSPRLPRN